MACLVLVIGACAWIFIGRPDPLGFLPAKTLTEFPTPPVPKFDPECPKTPTLTYDWHGVTFQYPEGWSVIEDDVDYAKIGNRVVLIQKDDLEGLRKTFESILISEEHKLQEIAQAVDAIWNLPQGEKLDPNSVVLVSRNAVPETLQRLEIDGSFALRYLRREIGFLPKIHDQWEIFLKRDGPDYAIVGPHMFHPYVMDGLEVIFNREIQEHNDVLACAYWTVAKSLAFPTP